jgi:hypothetical protein
MNDDLKALFPWLGSQNIQYVPEQNPRTQFKTIDNFAPGYSFNVNNQPFYFVPESYIQKGVQVNDRQIYSPNVLKTEFDAQLANSRLYTTQELAELSGQKDFLKDYEKGIYKDTKGYLIPKDVYATYIDPVREYEIGQSKDGFIYGGITGSSVNQSGEKFYSVSAGGKPNASAWVTAAGETPQGMFYVPGEKWYDTTLGKVGIALIVAGTAGLALGAAPAAGAGAAGGTAAGGTAAAGGAAGGTGLTVGAAGTTGLTAGAAGTTGLVAPAGFTLAPGVGATIGAGTAAAAGSGSSAGGTGLLDTAQFGQTGQTGITPGAAGQGLQVPTTPGLSSMGGGTGLTVPVTGGTVTQLGFVPTGATPVLGDPASFINDPNVLGNTVFTTDTLLAPGAATGPSLTDTLKNINRLRGLLGAGQNPIVPQQQGLPQDGGAAGRGVDYSGLLSLLQLQARTPNVASLTAPAQLRQIYQPTLLPNVLSLLG